MAELTVEQKNERIELALKASWEIDSCIRLLKQELPPDADFLALKGLARRIEELTSVVMSVTGDDDFRTTEEMREVVA